MAQPTISLLLCNYNHAEYLERAVGQLLGQTVPPLEIVVVDDGSTDHSLDVLQALAAQHPLLKLVPLAQNQGVCGAYNRALAEASGDFVFSFAADDHMEPCLVERVGEVLRQFPTARLVCWDSAGLDHRTEEIHPEPRGWAEGPTWYAAEELPVRLRRRGHLTGAVAAVSRVEFAAVGGLRPELRWYSDWFAITVVALRFGLAYVPECLSAFRMRPGSYCQRGHTDWRGQIATVTAMMGLLESDEFADVRPFFQRSTVLRVVGWRGLCVILSRRCWWRYVPLRLLQAVAVDCVLRAKAALFPYLPAWALGGWRKLSRLWRRPAGAA